MYNLVAIDLDGTLLDSDSLVTEDSVTYLTRLVEKGVGVVIATGRTWQGTKAVLKPFIMDFPLICYNGGLTYLPGQGVVADHRIDLSLTKHVIAFLEQEGVFYKTYVDDIMYVPFLDEKTEKFSINHNVHAVVKRNLAQKLQVSPNMIVILGDEKECDRLEIKLKQRWGDDVGITRSERSSLGLIPLGVSKGRALADYASKLGVCPQQCLAFGNEMNDLEMLLWAGLGVAMANSPQELQKQADLLASSNDEQGVLSVLKSIYGPL